MRFGASRNWCGTVWAQTALREGERVLVILVTLLLLAVLAIVAVRVVHAATRPSSFDHVMRVAERKTRRECREAYLDSLEFVNFYQLVIIFTVASISGLILETFWVAIDMGIWQSRYGMVWGPFSPLYGFGAVILTLALWKLRKQPLWVIFAVSLVLGSCLEQFAGSVMEDGFHVTSWTYSHLPDAITQYVSLRMSVIWGILGCVWCRWVMPVTIYYIGEPSHTVRVAVTWLLTGFLVADGIMTLYVAVRKDARDQGIPPANAIERYIDVRYDDSFMSQRFENAEFERSSREAAVEGRSEVGA